MGHLSTTLVRRALLSIALAATAAAHAGKANDTLTYASDS